MCGIQCKVMKLKSVYDLNFKWEIALGSAKYSECSKNLTVLPHLTEEIFTAYKRMACQVTVYKLKDDAGEILDETFYCTSPNCRKLSRTIIMTDVYHVEKILRKRKRRGEVEYFAKWKDYPDKLGSRE